MESKNHHYRRDRSRRPQTRSCRAKSSFPGERIDNTAEQGRQKVEGQELPPPIHLLKDMAEPPQKQHVKNDVKEVAGTVKEGVGKEPPNFSMKDGGRLEVQEIGERT